MISVIILSFLFSQKGYCAQDKLKVAASFYPLAHYAENVGGELADVINVMPPGAEPHEFEPTPRDIARTYDAQVFLFHGLGVDAWAGRIRDDLKKEGIMTVNMSGHFAPAPKKDDKEHDKPNREKDPHIWLDPLLAIKEVEIIRDVFIRADPKNGRTYRRNSTEYIKKLNALHEKYSTGLRSCARRDIIVTHDAFNYLAARYDLKAHPITGISPEQEPSPRKIVEMSKLALKENIKYIFYEKLVSSKLAETLAHEIGGKTLVLDPLGGLTKEDARKGKTYISVMEENLHNLRIALGCE